MSSQSNDAIDDKKADYHQPLLDNTPVGTHSLNQPPQEQLDIALPNLVDKFLRSLDWQRSDLDLVGIERKTLVDTLERLLAMPCHRHLFRWLALEDWSVKIIQMLVIDKRGIESEEIQSRSSGNFARLSEWISRDNWTWPRARSLPFKSKTMLKRIYGIHAFFDGAGSFIMRVWSFLLISFILDDLRYYFDPGEYQRPALSDIFLGQTENQKALITFLARPDHMGATLIFLSTPFLWGLVQAFFASCCLFEIEKAKEVTNRLSSYSNKKYQSSLFFNFFIWILPFHPLRNKINIAERMLLWDNRLVEEREEERVKLYDSIQDMVRGAQKITRVQLLETLCNIADSIALDNDFPRLTSRVEKKALCSFLKIKVRAFAELENLAKYPDRAKTGYYARYLKPLPHSTIARYMLWCLGQYKCNPIEILFLIFKGFKLYSKIILAVLIYFGIKEASEFITKKENCISAGRTWSFINDINDYDCTVCGDLPVFYRYSKTFTDCLTNYLQVPRTANQIITLLKRVQPVDEVSLLDLANQIFVEQNDENALEIVLKAVHQYLPNLVQLNFGPNNYYKSNLYCNAPSINLLGLQAIVHYLYSSKINILNLNCQHIGDQGISILTPALFNSSLQELYLEDNILSENCIQILASVLSHSSLIKLDLWWNNIQDNGIKILAPALINSLLQSLDLSFNTLSDEGAANLAEVLPQTSLLEVYLSGNYISNNGTQALASVLPYSSIRVLDLWGNSPINAQSFQVLVSAILISSLQKLSLEVNSADDNTAQSLALLLLHPELQSLSLAGNTIGDISVHTIATNLTYSNLQELALKTSAISEKEMQKLFLALPNSTLQTLRLLKNAINYTSVQTFASVLRHTSLHTLQFSASSFDNNKTSTVASALSTSSLQVLNLPNNNIGDDGLDSVTQVLSQSPLQYLYLYNNSISSFGAITLAQNLVKTPRLLHPLWISFLYPGDRSNLPQSVPNTALNFLDLSYNQINDSGAQALCKALPRTNIPTENLYLYGNPINKTIISDEGFCVYSAASSLRPPMILRFFYYFGQLPQNVCLYLQEYLSHIPISSLLYLSISNSLASFNLPELLSNPLPLLNYTNNGSSLLELSLENSAPTDSISNDAMIITLLIILLGSILYQLFQTVMQTTHPTDVLTTKHEISLTTQSAGTASPLNFLTKCWRDRSNAHSVKINQKLIIAATESSQNDLIYQQNSFNFHQ